MKFNLSTVFIVYLKHSFKQVAASIFVGSGLYDCSVGGSYKVLKLSAYNEDETYTCLNFRPLILNCKFAPVFHQNSQVFRSAMFNDVITTSKPQRKKAEYSIRFLR